ncbi:DoxX family membrane protein [Microvirga sp. STR05]|uniref:DoxX family membrane protein n=1 Tax=Hymenobacter duratus TaxID=2771356 RepID=A0ABR8JH21_9BACT|nr:DoxX family membrane protein [Hymenobacter duratus]MBD2716145.1 DoxX family membrane protein [Hymenobacter duratus]MBR7951059.1 DoxX family membrane protein [Microvirga sp. STR05]
MSPLLLYSPVILLPLLATVVALWAGGWWRRLYVLGARLLLGALMLGGGLYKLSDNHIPGLMGPPMNHAFLAEHSLEIFAQFIGVAQLLTGLLLLTGRFALLGAVLLVPMWLNIIFLTWSQHWTGTPFLVTGFLVLNVGLLLHDYARLKWLLYPPAEAAVLRAQPLQTGPPPAEGLWWLGIGLVVGGSLLYPVSFRLMQATMLAGLGLVLTAGLWLRRAGLRPDTGIERPTDNR